MECLCVCLQAFKPSSIPLALALIQSTKYTWKDIGKNKNPNIDFILLPTSLYRDNTILVQWPFFLFFIRKGIFKNPQGIKKKF